MATRTSPEHRVHGLSAEREVPVQAEMVPSDAPRDSWVRILRPLASLRLTVALFVMAIFIVFAGTLAQTEKDIWQVVHDYFRMDLGSPSQACAIGLRVDRLPHLFPALVLPRNAADSVGLRVLVSQRLADRLRHVPRT